MNHSCSYHIPSFLPTRSELTAVVPARLLLEPLFAQLPMAIERGASSTLALLETVTATTERMETKVAAVYHEQVG